MAESLIESVEQLSEHEKSVRLNLDGSVRVAEAEPKKKQQDGGLLDAALFNLNVAQQYIDESKYRAEHRLVCFHYAIALVARFRVPPNEDQLALARQYLIQATNWTIPPTEEQPKKNAYRRIVCEALYNIGVIDEIRKEYLSAQEYYDQARASAHQGGSEFIGVEILAAFGRISVMKKQLIDDWNRRPDIRKRKEVVATEVRRLKEAINAVDSSPEGKVTDRKSQTSVTTASWWANMVRSLLRRSGEVHEERAAVSSVSGKELLKRLRKDRNLVMIEEKLTEIEKEVASLRSEPSQQLLAGLFSGFYDGLGLA